MSLNPDTVIKMRLAIAQVEASLRSLYQVDDSRSLNRQTLLTIAIES